MELVETLGVRFIKGCLRALNKALGQTPPTQHCEKHRCKCSRQPQGNYHRHIEASGTTCVGFSTMGTGWSWLHASVIPFAAWLWLQMQTKPSIIIHENVQSFSAEVMLHCLNSYGDRYSASTCCIGPSDLVGCLSP